MKIFHKQHVIFLLAVLLFSGILFAQQVTLAGQILDEKLVPVENTTVYTKPLGNDESLVFSITDAQGNYKLKLSKEKPYLLTISHLGYKEITDTIILKEDITRDYTLEESMESLDEIILRRKLAIEVKKIR